MIEKKFKFENLRVWEEAVELSGVIFDVSSKFPKEELFVLTSQIRRAGDSVSLNIAEGSTGQSNAEFKRFLGIAIRSAIEVVGCIYLARRRKILSENDFELIYNKTNILVTSIQALRKKL